MNTSRILYRPRIYGSIKIYTTRDGFQHLIAQVSHIRFFRSFLYFLLRFAFRRILFYFFAEAVVQFFVFNMNTLLKKIFSNLCLYYTTGFVTKQSHRPKNHFIGFSSVSSGKGLKT